jgi:hypothetical protein
VNRDIEFFWDFFSKQLAKLVESKFGKRKIAKISQFFCWEKPEEYTTVFFKIKLFIIPNL